MTDKEQIIIDDVDVSGCSYYNPLGNYNCGGTKKCYQWSNCYFKQLTRKTQECEELKRQLQANQPTGICETCTAMTILQNDSYRTAITKIKEIAEFSYRPYSACGEYNESCIVLTNILNVIEELKEEK